MDSRVFKGALSVISLLSAFSTPALALDWQIKNLGVLPGAISSTGTALNDLGQVTGELNYGFRGSDTNPELQLYVYITEPNGGPLHLIDTSGIGPSISVYESSGINNSGQVVGTYLEGSSTNVGYITEANGGAVKNSIHFTRGVGINNSGTAVYQGTFGSTQVVAPDGTSTTIVPASTPAEVRGIIDAGQVAINLNNPESPEDYLTGAVWSEADGFREIYVNGSETRLFDINNAGQVLATASGSPLLVIDPDNTVHTLNISLTGQSAGIGFGNFELNDSGQVVGVMRDNSGTPTFSFLTSIGTNEIINLSMEEDIIAAGWSNIVVSDINNLGQISGTGTINGTTRAFLLTPVPEPETYAMMLAGLTILGFIRRRKSAATRQLQSGRES